VNDLALIATAASALTAAASLVVFHLYSGGRRRQLARVRGQRDTARAEARRLRADRVQPFADHAARAVALTEPIPYTVADRTAYLPVFDGDNPNVREYAEMAAAIRRKAGAR
jgi:hypothetical protein